jgi:sugar phosphate isomerase/epimerase
MPMVEWRGKVDEFMKRRLHCWLSLLLLAAPGLGAGLRGAAAQPAKTNPPINPFFAMDTALRDGKARSIEDQAALLKELGYDGIGASGHLGAGFLAAFESRGLKVFNTYLTLSFDSAKPGLDPKLKEFVPCLKGHDTALWVAINEVTQGGTRLKASSPEGDEVVIPALRELADLAKESAVKIAFYPHAGFWIERTDDAVRLARKVDRPNAGATFNLCHWLKVEGDRDPKPVLKQALPLLFFVSINGADGGETKKMNWDRLIQPLDQGAYDVAGLVRALREMGYAGPVGFQGYGIKGDSRAILRQTMEGWRKMKP